MDDKNSEELQVDNQRFWQKTRKFAQKAGKEVLEKALMLFYVAQSERVPKRIKVLILGALTYFVTTVDAIPDFVPLLGFTDDLGILVAAVGAVAAWINSDIEQRVDEKLARIFKEDSQSTGNSSGRVIDAADSADNQL